MGQKYRNDDIRSAITHNTKLDGYSSKVPSEIDDKIQLNIDVTPRKNRLTNFFHSAFIDNNTGHEIITLDASKGEFYITNFFLTCIATTISEDFITITINGANQTLISNISSNNGNSNISISLLNPLKLDSGSQIRLDVNSDNCAWGLYGYYVDPQIYDTGVDKTALTTTK